MSDIQLDSTQHETVKCPNITYFSTACLLCGEAIPITPLYSNTSMVCSECKKKWEKVCKMLDVMEELTRSESN